MKIAFILPSLANRGPIIFTQYLICELLKQNIYCEVFYFDEKLKNTINLGVKTNKISYRNKFDFSCFDIVHTTMARPDIYASRFVPREKWICSMHNYLTEDLKLLYNPIKATLIITLWKHALKKCKYIITSSNQMTDFYKHFLKKNITYRMIPYGIYDKKFSKIDENDYKVISSLKEKGLTILGSVGLLIPRKGFDQLFYILEKYKNTALVIIGEGSERQHLEEIIKKNNLYDRVYLPGFRNLSHNYYQYFDIYAHVSYSEGFGLAMLEAMSKKLPIICSNLMIYHDFFSEKEVALFEPGNKGSLISAYEKIMNNYQSYSNSSFSLFEKQFKAEIMATQHIDFYNNVVSCKK